MDRTGAAPGARKPAPDPVQRRSGARRGTVLAWISTVVRLGLAAVWLAAGVSKVSDLDASIRAVRAYDLLPEAVVPLVGAGLPVAEIALGLLLVLGLGVRASAVLSGLLLVAFVIGISAAWARGLQIDCGCFGGGGRLGAEQDPTYGLEVARDVGLIVLAGWLVWQPRTRLAVDNALGDGKEA